MADETVPPGGDCIPIPTRRPETYERQHFHRPEDFGPETSFRGTGIKNKYTQELLANRLQSLKNVAGKRGQNRVLLVDTSTWFILYTLSVATNLFKTNQDRIEKFTL